jgi:hypothetical protein
MAGLAMIGALIWVEVDYSIIAPWWLWVLTILAVFAD